MNDFCIICGEVVVEGRQVCHRCMADASRVPPENLQQLKHILRMLEYGPVDRMTVKESLKAVIRRMEDCP